MTSVATGSRRIGYIMSRFPKLTETFVLYEIVSLERQGGSVGIYPLRREKCRVLHPEAVPLLERAYFANLLSLRLVYSNLYWLFRRPLAYLAAWWVCLRATWGSARYFSGVLAAVPLAAELARVMQRDGVQHIHAHFASHPAAAALVISRLTGLPFSFTAHGSDLHRESRMLREKVAESEFAVTISEFNRRWMIDICGEEVRGKIHVVRCGIDPAIFATEYPPPDAISDGPLQILCVGSLHEVKGQSHLIRACAQLGRKGLPFHLHLVGEGPDRKALEHLVRLEELEERTTFHGGLSRPEVVAKYAEAHVVAAPSVVSSDGRREGIPVVLMEAMASGKPVVASRLSGIPELVADEQTGILISPGDEQELATALHRLAEDSVLRTRMGQAGKQRVARLFHLDREVGKLAALFGCRILDAPPSVGPSEATEVIA